MSMNQEMQQAAQKIYGEFGNRIQSLPLVQQFLKFQRQNQGRLNDPAVIAQMVAMQQQIESDPPYPHNKLRGAAIPACKLSSSDDGKSSLAWRSSRQASYKTAMNGGIQDTTGLPQTGLIGREQALQAGLDRRTTRR
jgi:hypothetical protein